MKLRRIFGWTAAALLLAAVGALAYGYWTSDNDCESRRSKVPVQPMQAITYCDYGTAEVLQLEDLEKPVPRDDEVLVRVRAAGTNPLDWHYMRGTPYLMRLASGLRRPAVTRLGVDFAGTVEAVGRGVTKFKPGDAVFGGRTGSFAQYLVVRQDRAVAAKPPRLSFEQAGSVGIAGITALQALRDRGQVRPGQRVLINGASGGVGTFAVQIAKSLGAHVTGVCSTRNVELVRSLGADEVVDYTREDYTSRGQTYDVIIDNVGNRALLENRRALAPDGRYVLIGGGGPDAGKWIGPMIGPVKALLLTPFVSQQMGVFLAELNAADLAVLAELMESGQVTPVIDREYPLAETAAAIRYLETGRARGKVVVKVE